MLPRHAVALVVTVGVLLAPAVGVLPATVAASDAANQPVRIDSCTVIDEPGEYVLTSDIEDSTAGVCIDIRSSDVHFDGDRHTVSGNLSREAINETITGPPPRTRVGVGVTVRSNERVENVTVHHVTVTNWNHGLLAENVTSANVSGVHAFENGGGIVLDDANDVTVHESNASRNLILGVIVDARSGNRTANNAIVGNELKDNGVFGAAMFTSSNATIADNTAFRNAFGIYAFGVQNSTIAANSVWDNRYGVVLEGFRSNATNVADANGTDADASAADASAADLGVQPEAVNATNARSNVLVNNVVRNSTAAALAFVAADDNVALGNDLSDTGPADGQYYPFRTNASAAVVAEDARNNTIVDARASDAADWIYAGFNGSSTAVLNATTDAGPVSFSGSDVGVGRAVETPPFPRNNYSVGVDLNVTTFGENTSLQVAFQYDDASLDAFAASEDDLDVSRYDADAANWTVVAGDVEVNPNLNTVAASLDGVEGLVVLLAEKGDYENETAGGNETANGTTTETGNETTNASTTEAGTENETGPERAARTAGASLAPAIGVASGPDAVVPNSGLATEPAVAAPSPRPGSWNP
ncbi:right-handed parallel beta-helix repeat-containing protein [Halorubellus sp. JP-L1]|uniref:right-handed parallel beta-helix repeat-containing protein n=1 Tax=Halorubellus sp. JP-L1 TaxID=2715753 RepID=UPI00140D6353|nr:right-handed parallel beta-helix repeat-containing protein [Halorubellus sp. JP-L1]NHN40139.1 right-handed parallel beta-helix repeat-containing protein [Halorubellus sp. JP-L1]